MHKEGVLHLDVKPENTMLSHHLKTVIESLAVNVQEKKGGNRENLRSFGNTRHIVDWKNIKFRV